MSYKTIHVDRKERFSIGIDQETGGYYVSIPVANRMVDYSEHYAIDKALAEGFPENFATVLELVKKCRNRENDEALLEPPGSDRGIAS